MDRYLRGDIEHLARRLAQFAAALGQQTNLPADKDRQKLLEALEKLETEIHVLRKTLNKNGP